MDVRKFEALVLMSYCARNYILYTVGICFSMEPYAHFNFNSAATAHAELSPTWVNRVPDIIQLETFPDQYGK